jgi:hypothetical protein
MGGERLTQVIMQFTRNALALLLLRRDHVFCHAPDVFALFH